MARATTAKIEDVLEYGVDVKRRRIYLWGAVCDLMAYRLVAALDILVGEAPITIYLSTPGGDVCAGSAIYDAIAARADQITIVGTGAVMSMGSLILQAAKTRILTPSTSVMLHHGTDGYEGDLDSFQEWARNSKGLRKYWNQILATRTGKTPAFWDSKLKKDLILTAAEAVTMGLADLVLEETQR